MSSDVSSVGSAVLGLRKLGACAAVSLGRLTLVEGGAVGGIVSLFEKFSFRLSLIIAQLHTRKSIGRITCTRGKRMLS